MVNTMKKKQNNLKLILLLIIISIVVFSMQLIFFKSIRDTVFYLLQDLAFIPIQIIVIYFVLETILEENAKKEKLRKLNVVLNAYFIETGTNTLHFLSRFDMNINNTKEIVCFSSAWTHNDFTKAKAKIKHTEYNIDCKLYNLYELKTYLLENKAYMLSMFQNPNLLEHDDFTDMLWAIFHIMDELVSRGSFEKLPDADYAHINLDIKRAYTSLLIEWISYNMHLKAEYPYLFSLAERKLPFKENSSVIIK